jgi:hypothetical protein
MKKFIPVLVVMLLLCLTAQAETFKVLEENLSAPYLTMDDTHFCIWDIKSCKFFIYSINGFSKVAEFGRKGEGPKEFMPIYGTVTLRDDSIYISQYPRLSVISKTGKLKKIINSPTDAGSFIPFGRNFIGTRYPFTKPTDITGKIVFSLYDSRLKKKKEIFQGEFRKFSWPGSQKTNVLYVRHCCKAVVYDKKLFIGLSGKGFFFTTYDLEGNKHYNIRLDYKKHKITNEYKKNQIDIIKKHWGKQWEYYKSRFEIVFTEYFPAFSNFSIDNRKIYVFMYPSGETRQEVLILDLYGKLLRKIKIPLIGDGITAQKPLCIKDEKIFYMYDNESTEKWEIRFEKLYENRR